MARVEIYQGRVNTYSLGVTLPLVRRTVSQIHQGALRLAPRGSHMSGSGARADGPNLQSSIEENIGLRGDTIHGQVGSRKQYAATAHQGSERHDIPLRRGKVLKFHWERGNLLIKGRGKGRTPQRFFFFLKVTHPGNKRPVRYLTTPMHLYGRANGFVTSSLPVNRSRLP